MCISDTQFRTTSYRADLPRMQSGEAHRSKKLTPLHAQDFRALPKKEIKREENRQQAKILLSMCAFPSSH